MERLHLESEGHHSTAFFGSLKTSSSESTMVTTNIISNIDTACVPTMPLPNASTLRNQMPKRRRRKSGRLWQLPESSIEAYANWILEKPADTQSPAERKFLQKYQRRIMIRQHKLPSESMKQYIARLERKENPSQIELQLIQQFHRRKAQKRAARRQQRHQQNSDPNALLGPTIPPPIFWKRQAATQKGSTAGTLALMANLQESMDRMGLSSEKLRDVNISTNT